MKKISELTAQLTPAEMLQWREGYWHHLESRGIPPHSASELASRVAYRPDLYPTDIDTPNLSFQLAPAGQTADAKPSPLTDSRPAKVRATKTAKPKAAEPTAIARKPKTTPATARETRLIKTVAKIAAERPDDDDRAYMHSIMCQVGLPRSKVDGTSFERHSGGAALLVEAGKLWDGKQFVQQPIPYGAMPRLMLAWMNTYAVRFNSPEIPVGDSASEFCGCSGRRTSMVANAGALRIFASRYKPCLPAV